VLLPVLADDGDLDWAPHDPAVALVRSARGLLEPAGGRRGRAALAGCDLVLVPALAVDVAGRRLGRGGGSYDRALPRARGLVVALLHDDELLDAVPAEPHDVPVGGVVTPSSGLVRLPLPGR
jgi:5-formyltetrahydrofolate cyclo-ligase